MGIKDRIKAVFTKTEKKLSKAEKRDRAQNIGVGLQAWSAIVSTMALGATLAVLNKKPKGGDEYYEPTYYMSEAYGLIQWK